MNVGVLLMVDVGDALVLLGALLLVVALHVATRGGRR